VYEFILGLAFFSSSSPPQGGPCLDPPAATVVTDTPTAFELTIAGTGIDETCSTPILVGTEWIADLALETVDGAHDMFVLSGTLTHVSSIPGAGSGSPIPIDFAFDAGDFSEGHHFLSFDAEVDHGTHRDVVSGTVGVVVFYEAIFDFHFVFDHDVRVEALHTAAVPSLPLRALALLLLGVAACGAGLLRLHRVDRIRPT